MASNITILIFSRSLDIRFDYASDKTFFGAAVKKAWWHILTLQGFLGPLQSILFFHLPCFWLFFSLASDKCRTFHVRTGNRCITDIHSLKACVYAKDNCGMNSRVINRESNFPGYKQELNNSWHFASYRFSQPRSPLWWGCTGPCPGPSVNGRPHLPERSWRTEKAQSH